MKRTICFLIALFSLQFSQSQTTKELLAADSAVWFGIDYSKAKFTGSFAQAFGIDPSIGNELVDKWVPEWNKIVLNEQQNFPINEAIKKPYTFFDISSVNAINSKINKDSVYSEEPMGYKIPNPDKTIPEMIQKYSSKKTGLGVVFIAESYNKKAHNAYVYFVLFRIETKQVIGYKRLMGIPKGIGLRNFWSGAIKDIIKQIGSSAYPSVSWNAIKTTK
jgi:hypothetical protein